MKLVLAAALVWRLVVMPTVPLPSTCKGDDGKDILCPSLRTPQNASLFKPFDIDGTFTSEADCKADATSNLARYLSKRGLPAGVTANFVCTTN